MHSTRQPSSVTSPGTHVYMSTVLARFGRASKKGSGNAYDALTRECNWNKIYMFQICTNPFLACLFIMNGFYTKCVLMVV